MFVKGLQDAKEQLLQESNEEVEAPRKVRELKDDVKDKINKLMGQENFEKLMEFYTGEDRHLQDLTITCTLSKSDRSELHNLIGKNMSDVASRTLSDTQLSIFRQNKRQKMAKTMNKKARY